MENYLKGKTHEEWLAHVYNKHEKTGFNKESKTFIEDLQRVTKLACDKKYPADLRIKAAAIEDKMLEKSCWKPVKDCDGVILVDFVNEYATKNGKITLYYVISYIDDDQNIMVYEIKDNEPIIIMELTVDIGENPVIEKLSEFNIGNVELIQL